MRMERIWAMPNKWTFAIKVKQGRITVVSEEAEKALGAKKA